MHNIFGMLSKVGGNWRNKKVQLPLTSVESPANAQQRPMFDFRFVSETSRI